ncbi:antizyme inhibitor 2-like [Clavelina lepadiformis]|uniref:antizyme inhibitor 2-like n=1 Tax=Clavelina lepadiformis TaxID=159417 RepID=UPI0040421866
MKRILYFKMSSEKTDSFKIINAPIFIPNNQDISLVENSTTEKEVVRDFLQNQSNDWDDSFFLGDLGDVLKKWKKWKEHLPRVEPFYAIKCNYAQPVVRFLAALGAGFDCASRNEIALALECGVDPRKIVYAHTQKFLTHLEYAKENQVSLMTLDSVYELEKIKGIYPDAKLLLRTKCDDETSDYPFGDKFGVDVKQAKKLIAQAKQMELNMVGICFHVGSGCKNAKTYQKAIDDAKILFNFAKTVGFKFNVLDIGGGFPGSEDVPVAFSESSKVIHHALNEHFPDDNEVRIIAEPGRYFVDSAFSLVTNVVGKKKLEDKFAYFIGDGVYSAFNSLLWEQKSCCPKPLEDVVDDENKPLSSTVYGISCDGADIINESVMIRELKVGEWLIWENMGAYTVLVSYGFNGFVTYKAKYFIRISDWEKFCNLSKIKQDITKNVYETICL